MPPDRSEPALVSVIMIFLNAETFIEEAIRSVIAQTYTTWELLLVDDGSSDSSGAIAKDFARQDPGRVRYLTHPGAENRGMSASRNLGLRSAGGELIAFLDADDIFLPNKLEAQVRVLRREPASAMVYGPSLHWHSWRGPGHRRRDVPRRLGVQPDQLIPPPSLVPRYLRLKAQTPATCAVMVRRRVAEAVGGFEEEFRGLYEDQVFFYKIAARWPIYVESTSRDLYRQHPASHVHLARQAGDWTDGRPAASYEHFLRWLADYLEREGIADTDLQRAVTAELWPYRTGVHRRIAALAHGARRRWRLLGRPRRSTMDNS